MIITPEALQDRERRSKIAAKIRKFADVINEIMQIIEENT